MIGANYCKRITADRWTAMTRLDQNRGATQLAKKAGVAVTEVENLIIYGNHSPTMFPDFANATISGKPVTEVIEDHDWLKNTFIPTVGKRGAAIIEARGKSSAASAGNALIDHVKSLVTVSDVPHSICVQSDGSYGFDEGIWASVPVITKAPGVYEVVKGVEHDEFAKEKNRRHQWNSLPNAKSKTCITLPSF